MQSRKDTKSKTASEAVLDILEERGLSIYKLGQMVGSKSLPVILKRDSMNINTLVSMLDALDCELLIKNNNTKIKLK